MASTENFPYSRFPKPFEFFKFFQYLMVDTSKKVYDVTSNAQNPNKEFIITIFCGVRREYLSLKVLLIDDSDINFYSIFSELVNDGEYYILVGSCGSSKIEDIGKKFYIKSAIKGDRGKLNRHNNLN
jgi:hypothetical protein